MPANDLIFQRLKAATQAELDAIAVALDEKLIGEPAADIALLSRELRKTAGHSLRNLWRDDHELPYDAILVDVVAESADKAGWPRPDIQNPTASLWCEDYALLALAFAALRKASSSDESAAARAEAEAAIKGQFSLEEAWKSGALTAAVIGGVAVLGGAIALSLLAVNRFLLSPKMKKVVPAVLVLIQIRLRVAAELSMGGSR
jgi:hypothetical protein